jgi:hypothetical protein
MSKIKIYVEFNIDKNTYIVTGNIRPESYKSLLEEIVRLQINLGLDNSEPNKSVDVFNIEINVNLSKDIINITSNCGNKGLETGILIDLFTRMDNNGNVK